MRLLRLIPDDTSFKFMRFRRISFPFSALLSVGCIVAFLTMGLNFGIDFRGGILMEVQSRQGAADIADLRAKVEALRLGDVQLQQFGEARDVLIRIEQQPGGDAAQQAAQERVRQAIGAGYEVRRVEVVGARVSGELVYAAVIAVAVSILSILVYLWFRFEWQFAVGAIIATLHDIVLTVGFFAVTQIDFDLSSVAVILTIVGYSLNDTVVVYDRVREMLRKYKKMKIDDLLDISMNSTLGRTVITSVTTILALIGLTAAGPAVVQNFTLAMLFGVVVGTYSSIFIAAPTLIYLGVKTQGEGGTVGKPAEPIKPLKS